MAENDQGGTAVQSTEAQAPVSTPASKSWEQAREGAAKELTSTEGGEQAVEAQAAQQTPPPEPTFDIDGKKYTLADIKKFRDGHLMQADYQRKTQAVAQMRKQLEEERGQFSQAVQRFQALVQERVQQQQKPQEEEETDPYLSEMKKRLSPLEERLQRAEAALKAQENWAYEAEVRSQQAYLDKQLKEMQSRYPYMQPQVVLAWISQDPNLDMETASRASHEFAEQQLQSYLARLQQQPQTQTSSPAQPRPQMTTGQPPGPPLKTPKTFDEAHTGAVAYLKELDRVAR